MDLSEINRSAALEDFLPTVSMRELNPDILYKVNDLRLVKTKKYGYAIVASLEKVGDEAEKVNVFLPSRMTKVYQRDDQGDQLNKLAESNQLFIKYFGGNYNKFKFCINKK